MGRCGYGGLDRVYEADAPFNPEERSSTGPICPLTANSGQFCAGYSRQNTFSSLPAFYPRRRACAGAGHARFYDHAAIFAKQRYKIPPSVFEFPIVEERAALSNPVPCAPEDAAHSWPATARKLAGSVVAARGFCSRRGNLSELVRSRKRARREPDVCADVPRADLAASCWNLLSTRFCGSFWASGQYLRGHA